MARDATDGDRMAQVGHRLTTRRTFLSDGIALAVALASAVAMAQPRRVPKVALVSSFLAAEGLGPDPVDANVRAFIHGLRDLGLVDGRSIVVLRRSDEGAIDRVAAIDSGGCIAHGDLL